MICTHCLKRLSRKTARIIDSIVMCSTCMFKPASERASSWRLCRIGSCHRHEQCMYMPCRSQGDRSPQGGNGEAGAVHESAGPEGMRQTLPSKDTKDTPPHD